MIINFNKISNQLKKLESLYMRIESIIRNKKFSGQFEPGEKLSKEEDLSLEYNISKITVRNDLSRLEAEGLIVKTPDNGTFITLKPQSKAFYRRAKCRI